MIAFKEGWHLADIEPGAREKYAEALDLIGKMEKHLYRKGSLSIFRPCHLLHLDPFAHRRVVRDMRKAYAMMSLFFPYATEQFAEEYEGDLWAHMILKQEERAKKLLDRRSATSNTLRPKDFWKELNEVRKSFYEGYPDAWDRAIRPIIAICKLLFSFFNHQPLLSHFIFTNMQCHTRQYTKKVSSATLTSPSSPAAPSGTKKALDRWTSSSTSAP